MRWSRNVLLNQIKSNGYERHKGVEKQHNFNKALPEHLAEQADQAMKDVYMLDILGVATPVLEAELEARMVNKIKDVMLELGYGFSFIGNQYRIAQNGKYFIDLLFYNRRLKALVALELKSGKFKPEYAGKMNFYLNLLDDFVKEKDENPSIGIILCAERDTFEVEYALRSLQKPVGVAEFQLTRELPKELSDKLPNAKFLEEEIKREVGIEMIVKKVKRKVIKNKQ
jgi:predicted nuclease of restriction endonuclease-like (RecB) superfamily